MFPAFIDLVVNERMGAWIDVSPDAIPVNSKVDFLPGFPIATGFSGHGFGIAPGTSELMAQIVMGETPVVDPTPYRHSRFIDGSPTKHWSIGFRSPAAAAYNLPSETDPGGRFISEGEVSGQHDARHAGFQIGDQVSDVLQPDM